MEGIDVHDRLLNPGGPVPVLRLASRQPGDRDPVEKPVAMLPSVYGAVYPVEFRLLLLHALGCMFAGFVHHRSFRSVIRDLGDGVLFSASTFRSNRAFGARLLKVRFLTLPPAKR